jgi:hypothetical protein
MKKLLFAVLTLCLLLVGSGSVLAAHAEPSTSATHHKPAGTFNGHVPGSYGRRNGAVHPGVCQALQNQLSEQQSYAHAIRADLYDPTLLATSEEAAIVRTMGTLQSQMSQVQASLNDCLNPGAFSIHPQRCQALQDQLVGLRYGAQVIKGDLSDSMLDPSEVAALSETLKSFQGQAGPVQAELNGC